MPDPIKQDGSTTGLRWAEEDSYGVVSGDEVWNKMEPNSYEAFGVVVATAPREIITDDRMDQKGPISDVDATGAFTNDLTQSSNVLDLMQGFWYSDYTEKGTTKQRNAAQISITAVDTVPADDQYEAASGLDGIGLIAEHLMFGENFDDAGNNGLTRAKAVAAGAIDVYETLVADASPAATAMLTIVGYQFAVATVDIVMTGSLPSINRASGAVDFTTIGVGAGDWIWIGGDGANEDFVNAANNGWARVKSVAADDIFLDIADATMVNETGTGLTIRIFFGHKLINDPLGLSGAKYSRRTYQLERTLGADDTASPAQLQSQYIVGSVPNELGINIPATSKATLAMSFVGKDEETRTGATGLKAGTRPAIGTANAYGTTSDVNRIKLNVVSTTDANPAALFPFITELTANVNNNVQGLKAIANLGSFEAVTGNFTVTGSLTAYFTKNAALDAIRNNSSVAINSQMARDNKGLVLDIPNATLAGGPPNVELNAPITLPLTFAAFKDATLGYVMSLFEFRYLPTAAM